MAADTSQLPGMQLTPQQRLAQSRRAIARQLSHGREGDEDNAPASSQESHGNSSGVWPLMRQAFGAWWAHHPAHAAATLAAPVLGSYVRARPLQVLGLAAGAGAVVVLARPWRRAWLGRLLGGALGSAEMSGLLISLLHGKSKKDPR